MEISKRVCYVYMEYSLDPDNPTSTKTSMVDRETIKLRRNS